MRLIDITGQKFGRLTVLRRGPPSPNGGSLWECECDCGKHVTRNASNMRNGSTLSCGCLLTEWTKVACYRPALIAARAKAALKHGHKRRGATSLEYKTWLGMKRRCNQPGFKDFKNWGGRGIKVCDRWNGSFEAFLADMGPRPSATHSIDRLDPNGHYEPVNCRWATAREQCGENRRNIYPVTIYDVTYPSISAACRHYGISPTVVNMRVNSGHNLVKAITTPRRAMPNRRTRESYLPRNKRA